MRRINRGRFFFLFRLLLLEWLMLAQICFAMEFKKCDRVPEDAYGQKSPLDNRFHMTIEGNPEGYIPEEDYTIRLGGSRVLGVYYKFIGFLIVVEKASSNVQDYSQPDIDSSGTFSLYDDNLSKFSEKCPNAVTQKSDILKGEITVNWTAPRTGSGCVIFRATIRESSDTWYMDDETLTKLFCEDEQDTAEKPSSIVDHCCACEEAKYEITFERLWSRHTHSNDFPSDALSTRFSDIIGVSHKADYRFWKYGDKASPGLKQIAENRITLGLENELKENSDKIRTFFRARGVSQPDSGKTYAVFRTDSLHHRISLVSAIDPSPDWIVGVSNLELCNWNCTWVQNKKLNLYPWDVGTDSGITYLAIDNPTNPADVIRRLKPNYPNDPKSPFFDPSGADMKPMARLKISLTRTYQMDCEEQTQIPKEEASACETSSWGDWSECSVKCGEGKKRKQRVYIDPAKATNMGCLRTLFKIEKCIGSDSNCLNQRQAGGFGNFELSKNKGHNLIAECALTEWSQWSKCNNNCGRGFKIRSRSYIIQDAQAKCEAGVSNQPKLYDRAGCQDSTGCIGEVNPIEQINNRIDSTNCGTTPWSEWGPCSATCGYGQITRIRQLQRRTFSNPNVDDCSHVQLREEKMCGQNNPQCDSSYGISQNQIPHYCMMPPDAGTCRDFKNKWFYDPTKNDCGIFSYSQCGGNENRFDSLDICLEKCRNPNFIQEMGMRFSNHEAYN